MATATAPCPMKNCKEVHQVLEARNKKGSPYISCRTWRSVVFLDKTPAGMAWLNGSRSSRENPAQQDLLRSGEAAGHPVRTVFSEGRRLQIVLEGDGDRDELVEDMRMTKATAAAKKTERELFEKFKVALLEDQEFIDAIASALPSPASPDNMPARPNPSPLDIVEAIYAANPGLREINIVGNCSGCGHPVADQDTACISCGETLED